MPYFHVEQSRTQSVTALDALKKSFPELPGCADAVFLSADRRRVLGFAGLPFAAPVCGRLLADAVTGPWLRKQPGSFLFCIKEKTFSLLSETGSVPIPEDVEARVRDILDRVLRSPGKLNERGELELDLLTYPVGPHYPVNLLLGNRAGYPYPLYTTPKSALDSLGRGSFRATGGQQVLATRFTLDPSENGEPANRQFYLTEDGVQIFYSADVRKNVLSAKCVHSQNRTVITYQTACGLEIRRTIFLLPQEEGLPNAVEAQRVEIVNRGTRTRRLRIVTTGVFGITNPETLAGDIVYANIVAESELWYGAGSAPAALTLHHNPKPCAGEKRFALLLCGGETMDEFCSSLSDFVGGGTLDRPDAVAALPNQYSRKMAPFFALAKSFSVEPGETAVVDEFVGMMEVEDDVREPFDAALHALIEKYRDPAALAETFARVVEFWDRYPRYIVPETEDAALNAYVSRNLPFQVLYQTYVSRAFAWTQKSYRETGFREIQDIFASMYYLSAIGENGLIKELLSAWIENVFRMGYAYHDFTFRGKEPGDCSDDQLWLAQAVHRYVKLTGDYGFLLEEFSIAGEDASRSLWDTLMAILTYSGRISVGAHGMPLLDKADWNDTLRLDSVVFKGPEKERCYRAQLEAKGQAYGVPWENTMSESVMNACLLIIAADAAADMAPHIGKDADGADAAAMAERVRRSVRENAWKGDYFARCLINNGRGYEYLGATGDGLSLVPEIDGTYFLNSFSWPILADTASEDQIASMLRIVERYLKTPAGLKLCTLVDFDKLDIDAGTQLYFPGDRENGGVFKHAAMMATVAALKAAKWVKSETLADRLRALAFFMIDRTVPYAAMRDPFVIKGNPRFCTQYNNSETREAIGPMLSGTASWLTLAVFESFGPEVTRDTISFSPILRPGAERLAYTMNLPHAVMRVSIAGGNVKFRADSATRYILDGQAVGRKITLPADEAAHSLRIIL